MSTNFTTDNIDRLQAFPLEQTQSWEIRFRSCNDGMYHQLYINGSLADWTDTTKQRSFIVPQSKDSRELVVAATDSETRSKDLSNQLPADNQKPSWIYSADIVRSAEFQSGDKVNILSDHATGEIDDQPVKVTDVWPIWISRWAWGEDAFGTGGFGYDGHFGPGLGRGAFGVGLFGIDTTTACVQTALNTQGQHKIILQTQAENGQTADSSIQFFWSSPPPQPAKSITITQYDKQNRTVTIEIERG